MSVILTNLSNVLFKYSRMRLNESAKKFRIPQIRSFDFNDLFETTFFKENKKILLQRKGLGYWLWKPFIILEGLKAIKEGEILIYSDCGIEIIGDLRPLIDLSLNETDILVFANSNYQNKIWTKRDCFILMECDEEKYWSGQHADAAFCLFKKSDKSIKFVSEWLMYATNENILTDLPNTCGAENFSDFIEHRWDQSILSLLAIKYNLSFYRMPTQFGNHYKIPDFRVINEFNCINQGNQNQLNYYSTMPFENSKYYQILNHHRKKNSYLQEKVIFQDKNKLLSKIRQLKVSLNLLIHQNRTANPIIKHQKSLYRKNSYSQCAEDLIVQYIFSLRGINKFSYIDIGAHHPYFLSNTALFYDQGCRGINIEANPQIVKNFMIYRSEDINLNVGISDKEGELDFYIMEDNTLSTFSREDYDFMVSNGKKLAEIKRVKVTPLLKILETYWDNNFPDFMSIDVEGMDFQILQSINFSKSYPKIICVEAAEYSPIGAGKRRNELIDFLVSRGYYEYANTNLNAIMVKNEFWFI